VIEHATVSVPLFAAQRDACPVPSGDIVDAVGRSPAATTEILQRLENRGLVTHEPYEGATLTREGRRTAADLCRTYTTLRRFVREVLELESYEREATRLASTVGSDVADRLDSALLAEPEAHAADADDPVDGGLPE
jgi:DtxR family Mn-dependent transcriptional regulator